MSYKSTRRFAATTTRLRAFGKPSHVPGEPGAAVADQDLYDVPGVLGARAARPPGCRRACGTHMRSGRPALRWLSAEIRPIIRASCVPKIGRARWRSASPRSRSASLKVVSSTSFIAREGDLGRLVMALLNEPVVGDSGKSVSRSAGVRRRYACICYPTSLYSLSRAGTPRA